MTTTTTHAICLETVDCRDRLSQVNKLDKAVKSLACNSLHDDVDWLQLGFADDSGVATKECENFRAGDSIWDLYFVSRDNLLEESGYSRS